MPTVNYSPGVMIWGTVSAVGHGWLFFLPKGIMMNAQRYQRILEDHLVNFMHIYGCTFFQHDCAACHTANMVTKWLAETQIEQLDWRETAQTSIL